MPSATISLYIHIPFCIKKCLYCDFYSIPYEESLADDFIKAIMKEWSLIKKEMNLESPIIQTLFFGGGTPSILSVKQWNSIHQTLIRQLNLADDVEWTIECNPDSFSEEKLMMWRSMGVTRLTIGIQSLDDNELQFIGRPHSADRALSVLHSPTLCQFNSVGLDLMYGLPNQTIESFGRSLSAALLTPIVRHLSAYELMICPHTPFGRIKNLPLPDEDIVCEMTRHLISQCKEHGFERYEISNFAKKGHRCRHNEAYWSHSPYIGLGPGAHSYIHPNRWANVSDVKKYLSLIHEEKRPIDLEETIDKKKLIAEMIFLELRTADGLDEDKFRILADEDFYSGKRKKVADRLLEEKLIIHNNQKWSLTEDGMMIGDAIARKLL